MGNKKNSVWVVELYTSKEKDELVKVYEFTTIRQVAYVLDMKPSTISNFYHSLIAPRGNLNYVNIYQKKYSKI